MARQKQSKGNPGDLVSEPLSPEEIEIRRKEAERDGVVQKPKLFPTKKKKEEALKETADEIISKGESEVLQDKHFNSDRTNLFKFIADTCAEHAAAAHQSGQKAISQQFKILGDVAKATEKKSAGVKYWRRDG